MRLLHTMLRVGDLQRSINFYTNVLGMTLLRTSENPEYKYSLAFVGYGPETDEAVIELTYNWGVESYELDVVDYLLKPISFARFLQAIDKVRNRKGSNTTADEKRDDDTQQITNISKDFITVKDSARIYKVNYSDLLFVEGQREYVTFHTQKNRITALYTLKSLEEKLPGELFIRIHKSYIVSFCHIEMIERNQLTIAGKTLPIGNNYKADLLRRINN